MKVLAKAHLIWSS